MPVHDRRSSDGPAPSIAIRMLGAVELAGVTPERANAVLARPKRLALLARLAMSPGRFVRRDALADLLWPSLDRERALKGLRNALYGLRAQLGAELFLVRGDAEVAVDPERIGSDVGRFEAAVAAKDWSAAAALIGGEFLPGLRVADAEPFAEWLDAARVTLRAEASRVLRLAAEAAIGRGDRATAIDLSRRAAALAADDEASVQRLLRLLIGSGDRAGALAAYHAFRSRLMDRFGARPSAATERLVDDAHEAAVAAVAPAGRRERGTESHFQRGLFFFLRGVPNGDPADLEESRRFFDEMRQRDPDCAVAYAGLANYYAVAATRQIITPFAEHFAHALALSADALRLDPSLAIPHVHYGVKALYLDSDWPTAGREFATATALEPWYAEARRVHGVYLQTTGDMESALAEFREAVALEPRVAWFHNALGAALLECERHDEAIRVLARALELDPGYRAARERLVRTYEALGAYEDAVATRAEAGDPLAPRFEQALRRAGADGYREERRAELDRFLAAAEARLTAGAPLAPAEVMNPLEFRVALGWLEHGDPKRALRWIERGCAVTASRLRWIAWLPQVRPLRGEPRFRALAAAAGITLG